MRIEKVTLENVKSYNENPTEIPLRDGVNAILGENGAGKTTVLEAVGYVLFDYLPYTQGDFIREGADHGRASVQISTESGTFTVERHLGKSKYRVLEDGKEIVTQKQDVIPWLRDEFGIPESLDLSTLWEVSIGVPQGQLTADFTKPPKERRRSFDPVLQTAAYTDAWEEMRQVQNAVDDEISELKARMEGLKAKAEGLEDRIEEKERVEKSLENLESSLEGLREEQESLKKEMEELESAKEDLDDLRSSLRNKESEIKSLEDSLEDASDLLKESLQARDILSEVEDAYEEYEEKKERKEKLKEELEGKDEAEKRLREAEKRLAELETREEDLEERAGEAQKAKERMRKLEEEAEKQEDLEKEVSSLEAEGRQLRESILLLERVEDAECPTCKQILPEDQRRKVLKAHREKKSSVQEEMSELEEELEELGSPKEKLEKARARYRESKGAGAELEKVRKEVEEAKETRDEIEKSLESYESREKDLELQENKLTELEDDHERYVRNEDLASKTGDRREKVEDIQERLEQARDEKSDIESELEDKEKTFDEERFEEASSRADELKSKLSEVETRIDERKSDLEELEEEMKEKREAKEKLEEEKKELNELEKDLEFVSFVREGIQDAQPLVTEALVRKISEAASSIYQELRGGGRSLEWTKDYQIVVWSGSEKKPFRNLSGGEQVCAALSVRLAVLRELAPVSFAFLDEPTESLDGVRKRNLASQLDDFDVLDQLCVISHDRVFEGMTDWLVSLEKTSAGTRRIE